MLNKSMSTQENHRDDPTPTPIRLDGILLFICVCDVNILQKDVHVCVCVYSGISMDMAMGGENMRFGVTTNHRGIEGVIGHLCLIGFNYLELKHAKKPSL